MTSRLSFSFAQPTIIVGWYISSFLLIGLVSAAPIHLPLQNRTFSQAFYYAILAAAVYFIVASMMVVTAFGVYIGRYSRRFKLTMGQRALMFQTVTFLGYLLAAGAVYSRIEGWDFLDAVYYVDVTLFTIGFGDFSPKTHLGRSLMFPMAIGGILFVGLIIASIRSLALERGSKKVSMRMVEKAREKVLKNLDLKHDTIRASPSSKNHGGNKELSELDRREQEFNIMRRVQKKAANDNRLIALGLSAGAWLFLWFIGAVVFWKAEQGTQNWSYFESLYFTYVSLLTIGYGDFYPQDNASKPVFVFWSLIALPTLTVLIGSIGDTISESVDSFIIWIGDHLPEKTGALADLKNDAANATKGDGGAFQEAKPPGFMSRSNTREDEFNNQSDAVKGVTQDMANTRGKSFENNPKAHDERTKGKYYRHNLLTKQIQTVIQHLDASPPRKYSFAEWTWFLQLIGQDESSPTQHRRPRSVQEAQVTENMVGGEQAGTKDEDGEVRPWSWLGPKSPLMSAIDEPKWVLERLMTTLERELRETGEREERKEREMDVEQR